jgi:hypothetical protein
MPSATWLSTGIVPTVSYILLLVAVRYNTGIVPVYLGQMALCRCQNSDFIIRFYTVNDMATLARMESLTNGFASFSLVLALSFLSL